MCSKLQIKAITATDTYTVRHPILRAGKPIATCVFSGDDLNTTLHLGGYILGKLVAIASFMEASNPLLPTEKAMQLRGMAVLTTHQGKGYGAQLLLFGETQLQNRNYKQLWMNARINALPFYQKLQYQAIGDVFNIDPIGLHQVVYKSLS